MLLLEYFEFPLRIASVKAAIYVILPFPESAPAKATPIAIPSGILWSVTDKNNIIFFFISDAFSFVTFIFNFSNKISIKTKIPIPSENPTVAGNQVIFP